MCCGAAVLIETSKEGLCVTYRLSSEDVADFYLALRRLGETGLAELDRLARSLLNDTALLVQADYKSLLSCARRAVEARTTVVCERIPAPALIF